MLLADFLAREQLTQLQERKLSALLDATLPANLFHARKFEAAGLNRSDIHGLNDLQRLPTTTKGELIADQEAHPPFGSGLTYSLESYTRLHQTSGTKGAPLRWLDTPQSWNAMLDCWTQIYSFAQVTPCDRLLFAFSFGPFLGFWTAFESASRLGCLCLATGGMSTGARLRMLIDNQATVLLCTPTYALHLAQAALAEYLLDQSSIRKIIVAGEPGGSIPATRSRIEEAWRARVYDHSGMTEVGPVAIECQDNPGGLHILEADYVAEVIDSASEQPVNPGQLGELVLTTLSRLASPLVRYRTGDLVRVDPKPCPCGRSFVRLDGGILGRTDDMVNIRGNNFYPSALEGVIRRFAEVAEYRVEIDTSAALAEVRVEIEPVQEGHQRLADRIAMAIRDELLFRAEVKLVAPGTLPRFEMKAQRIRKKQ
ncbi:MAG: AMP-binding protein [Gemmataceae bacterium]|nr:AMP-binding protein [Gemmataceae bacterium]